ncbi:PIG-L family deacetylase [bacterium]|nr:MAG: PIG-L family deacetylase [bacterium]
MLNLDLARADGRPRTVLCLGAHCDDIEIGCGGTLLRLAHDPDTAIHFVVFSSNEERAAEARRCAAAFIGEDKHRSITLHGFRDGFLPWSGADVKSAFEDLKTRLNPDLVFTHYAQDLHQDHRLVSELTWNTFRDHLILEYEIPKWDGDMGRPQAFVELEEGQCDHKVENLIECYASQSGKSWFNGDVFRSLARLRGMECNAESGMAEAFYCRKATLGL